MTDRDMLIKLFEEIEKDPAITCPHYITKKSCDECKYTINDVICNHTLRTVDYLLANGVVVLDMSVIAPKNRPLITHIAERPLNDVLELLRAEQEGRLIVPPCKVGDLPDRIFSHNSVIAIWVEIPKEHCSQRLWRGMAWDIPEKYKKMQFKRIFGSVPENIYEGDTINVLVELTKEEAEEKLRELNDNG